MTQSIISEIADALWNLYDQEDISSPSGVSSSVPCTENIKSASICFLSVALPSRFSKENQEFSKQSIQKKLLEGSNLLRPELEKVVSSPEKILHSLLLALPDIRSKLIQDTAAAYSGDPAAASFQEVIIAYPGLFAISAHRVAHELYKNKVPLIPRIISEWAHSKTGIDIHPGAVIEEGFFIDHGTGVVIGETSRIGKHVKIYQGVTLGARSFTVDETGALIKGQQRHPIVEDKVVLYANATILGGETVIGKNSIIGSNVFIMESIPPDSLVISKASSDSTAKNFSVLSK
jgi:serine O-acetyltransferase